MSYSAAAKARKVKRLVGSAFEKLFDVEVAFTRTGDRQLSVTHKPTGMVEYGILRLGISDDGKRVVINTMMDTLFDRVREKALAN